jgi:hypothetical protein
MLYSLAVAFAALTDSGLVSPALAVSLMLVGRNNTSLAKSTFVDW